MSRFSLLTFSVTLIAVLLIVSFPDTLVRKLCLSALFTGYGTLLVLGMLFPKLNLYLKNINRVPGAGRKVALTFDDGPDPVICPLLLDLLRELEVPATFFYVGQAMAAHPDLVRRADAEGHLLGNHSFQHSAGWACLRNHELQKEIGRANALYQELIGKKPRFFRSPFSVTRPRLKGVLDRLGLVSVGWDIRGVEGSKKTTPEAIAEGVVRHIREGSVLLLHERYFQRRDFVPEQVLRSIRMTVTRLREQGYQLLRLDVLLGEQGYQTPVARGRPGANLSCTGSGS